MSSPSHPIVSPGSRRAPPPWPALLPLALLGAVLAAWQPAAQAQAQAPASSALAVRSYDIPGGPLGQVLARLASESGVLLAATSAQVSGKVSPGVRGSYGIQAALDQALTGSGLVARRDAVGQYRLEALAASDVATLPAVTVTESRPSAGGLPPVYAGGQVARGGRLGLLGNRDVMDTPFSTTQYTAEMIEDQQAQNIGDALVNDPAIRNTYSRGSGRDEFNIRGFTLFNYDVSFNGLFGISPRNASSLIGVERVEVLRGPNALLTGMAPYGSIGGGINLVPKRAGDLPLNRLTLSYIGKNQLGAHADVARRFGEDQALGVRVNAEYRKGDLPVTGGREALGALTTGFDYQAERWRFEADLSYQDRLTHARSGLLFPDAGIVIGDAPDARSNFFPAWTYWKTKEWAGSARLEFDLVPDWTAYAALGGRKHKFQSLQTNWLMLDDEGGIAARPARLNESLLTRTGEVGVRGRFLTGPVTHQPVLSASAFSVDYGAARIRSAAVFSNLYAPADLPEPDIARPDSIPQASESRLHSVALADTLSILDGRVQLTAGVRRQAVRSRDYDTTTGAKTSDYKESAVTPAVALVVKPIQRLSLYTNYIEGLSQGPTAPEGSVNAGEVFAPFISRQFEVGAKYDAGRHGVVLSLFRIDQPSSYVNPASMIFTVDGNQRNRGVELLTYGEVMRGVRLLGGMAYTDAKLTRTAGGLYDGNSAPAVPRWQWNLSGEWDTPFVPGLTLTARVIRTSSQYVDVANTQSIPHWTRLDLGARYILDVSGKPVTVRATVENVLNKSYWQSAAREGLTVGTPLTALLSVSMDF